MSKRNLIAFGVIFILALFTLIFLYSRASNQEKESVLSAVPADAAILIRADNFEDLWSKLDQSNLIWEELATTNYFNQINKMGLYLDSIIEIDEELDQLFENEIFVSSHISGSTFSSLFYLQLPGVFEDNELLTILKRYGAGVITSRDFSDHKIYDVVLKNKLRLSLSQAKGILILSFNTTLIEKAILQLQSEDKIELDKGFVKVRNTAGSFVDANIYLNYQRFPKLLSIPLSMDNKEVLNLISKLAYWGELDVKIRPNSIMLNGYTCLKDSVSCYLEVFKNQQPQEIEMAGVLPLNTSTFVHFGLGDINGYLKAYKAYLLKMGLGKKREKVLDVLLENYELDMEEEVSNWLGNEFGVAYLDNEKLATEVDKIILVKVNQTEEALETMNKMGISISSYKEFEMGNVNNTDWLRYFFGEFFSTKDEMSYTLVNNYLCIGSQKELKTLIDSYSSGKTLRGDVNFNKFSEEISSHSNITIYSNIPKSKGLYYNILNKEYQPVVKENVKLLDQFQAFAYQLKYDKSDLFYNNVFCKFNPGHKQETTSLWETQLDSNSSFKPSLVKNHISGAKDIFVQDQANNVYLISNTGKILWTRKLKEKILSEIQQIDIYKNNKFQILFNTASHIYLLDRNGKDVESYPVKLPFNATSAISVMDYENNKNYRILVACDDKKIYNYDQLGRQVKGWDFERMPDVVSQPLKHFTIRSKDYVVAIDNSGNVRVVDRKGEERLKIKQKVFTGNKHEFFIEMGNSLGESKIISTDEVGNILKLSFENVAENITIREFDKNYHFVYKDLHKDGTYEYIYTDQNKLTVYNQEKDLLFDYEFKNEITSAPTCYDFGGEGYKIGVVNEQLSAIYLFNNKGILQEGFPYFGSNSFSIGDINKDGSLELISGASKFIYTYNLGR